MPDGGSKRSRRCHLSCNRVRIQADGDSRSHTNWAITTSRPIPTGHGNVESQRFRHRTITAGRVEWEANSFAAELLMPTRLFRRDARTRDVSFEVAYELMSRDMYDVSATAAARRMVQVTNEPCALVVTRQGRVEWQERSRFYYPMATRGQLVRGGTIAAAVTGGDSPNAGAEPVDPADWLDRLPEGDFTLLESTHVIPSLEQVLSLLWIPDLEE